MSRPYKMQSILSLLLLGLIAHSPVRSEMEEIPTQEITETSVVVEKHNVPAYPTMSHLSKFAVFKYGKYPTLTTCDPVTGSLEIIALGTAEKNGVTRAPKAAQDYTRLMARNLASLSLDNPKEKKTTIFKNQVHETLIGYALETILRGVCIIDSVDYKGVPLVDQYYESTPMWWALENAEQAAALATYVAQALGSEQHEIKPLLYVDIRNNKNKNLDPETEQTLARYFTLIAPTSAQHKTFKKFLKHLRHIQELTATAEDKYEDGGLDFFKALEKPCQKFDTKKMAIATAKWAAVFLTATAVYELSQPWLAELRGKMFGWMPQPEKAPQKVQVVRRQGGGWVNVNAA